MFTRESIGQIPTIGRRTESVLSDLVVTAEMILKELRNINTKKSCGPDALHPPLLTELAVIIKLPVALLFNATIDHGVLAIYKRGSRNFPFRKLPPLQPFCAKSGEICERQSFIPSAVE